MSRLSIEGFVIVSADGRLTDEHGEQPDQLRFDADHRFFVAGLRRAALVVHGRNSGDSDPKTRTRHRVIVTRSVAKIAAVPDLPNAVYWNPGAAPFEEAAERIGITCGTVAVIGGPSVYALFLPRYAVFWLSQALRVQLPGGTGCFPEVPTQRPEDVLFSHGLMPGEAQVLDAVNDVRVTPWRRV